jgi:hypothetical protein
VGNYAAPPIFTGLLFGLSMLLTIILVAKAESGWKYLIAIVPIALLAATVYLLVRAAKTPDPAGDQQQV